MVEFDYGLDYKHALYEGPWAILDHFLMIRRCRPFPPPSVLQLKKMLVWARIPDLPTEQRRFSMEGWESSWRKLLVPIIMVLGKTLRIEYGGIINLQPIAR